MKNKAVNVTLEAFKDEIDSACKDGDYRLTVATMAVTEQLDSDELREALQYAAKESVTLEFIPDAVEYEPDYHPHNDPIERAAVGFSHS